MKLFFHQKLGRKECPYMERWVLDFGLFSIRLHRWFYGDDPRAFHDHMWNFLCIVLRGSYIDVSPDGEELMAQGTIRYRKAEHRHTVSTQGCWTLLFCGPEIRQWGFWVWNKSKTRQVWFKAKRYFIKSGEHHCE